MRAMDSVVVEPDRANARVGGRYRRRRAGDTCYPRIIHPYRTGQIRWVRLVGLWWR
jgi:hypothetical protein